jgi:hypothetical protein
MAQNPHQRLEALYVRRASLRAEYEKAVADYNRQITATEAEINTILGEFAAGTLAVPTVKSPSEPKAARVVAVTEDGHETLKDSALFDLIRDRPGLTVVELTPLRTGGPASTTDVQRTRSAVHRLRRSGKVRQEGSAWFAIMSEPQEASG